MIKTNLIPLDSRVSLEERVWEAEVFAAQAKAWMRRCPMQADCPGAKIFAHIIALNEDRNRLKFELKRIQEYEDN